MKITSVSIQARDSNRVNIAVDGKYRFSLDVSQAVEFKIKTGNEYSEQEIKNLESESQFGKLYNHALEYCLTRPRSEKEVLDYLFRKTMNRRDKTGSIQPGVSKEVTARVFEKLLNKKYVDNDSFARYWVENRNTRKGMSKKKLVFELRSKGVPQAIIDKHLGLSERLDSEEIKKIIEKKRSKYSDDKKMMEYLARQGFNYDDIREALSEVN